MYKLLIVEDEPPTLRYLVQLIETKCKHFYVAGTAENGIVALQKVRELKPDVVLTDIKMPLLDGIGLVKQLKEAYPDICSVIVSGYQDFEYAKEAFKLGIVDYLLKPIKVDEIQNLMNAISEKLDQANYLRAKTVIEKMLKSGKCSGKEQNIFEDCYFTVMVVRRNCLPSRFTMHQKSLLGIRIFNDIKLAKLQSELGMVDVWMLEGRDQMEAVLVFRTDNKAISCFRIKELAHSIADDLADGINFYTIAYTYTSFNFKQLEEHIYKLYAILNHFTVIGKNQILDDTMLQHAEITRKPILGSIFKNKIEFLAEIRSMDNLKQEIVKKFNEWEQNGQPQICVESMIRSMLEIIAKYSSVPPDFNIENQMSEAIFYSTAFGELLSGIWDIVTELLQPDENGYNKRKIDSLSLFQKIDEYIGENLSEVISLQTVCSQFGVSQTYLSRLFRKYRNTSFNKYVTMLRIDAAKQMMSQDSTMRIKDIALILGYKDQYYFSRVFKSITGIPPSDYHHASEAE